MPVSAGRMIVKSLSLGSASAQASHMGLRSRFVDENEPVDLKIFLCRDPFLPRQLDVFSVLLAGA